MRFANMSVEKAPTHMSARPNSRLRSNPSRIRMFVGLLIQRKKWFGILPPAEIR